MVTSHASMLLSGRRRGYAWRAARNVSDQASSASTGPTTARQTRRTVGPCAATISSKGLRLMWLTVAVAIAVSPRRGAGSGQTYRAAGDAGSAFREHIAPLVRSG